MGLIVGVPISHGDMKGLDPDGNVLDANPIVIGHDVWVGKDVAVFGGVTIGHGCVVGAKSLVTKDCEPYGIYAGTPARLIRRRFSDAIVRQLMDLNWWDWPVEKLRANAKFFDTDFTSFEGCLGDLVVEAALAA